MRRTMAVLLVAVAAACSSGSSSSPATTTTTIRVSSVEQVASVVAEHGGILRDDIAKEDACTSIDCLVMVNLSARWNKINGHIRAAKDALNATQPWPAEIDALGRRTVAALQEGNDLFESFEACLRAGGGLEECGDKESAFERSFRGLPAVFDAWAPYSG